MIINVREGKIQRDVESLLNTGKLLFIINEPNTLSWHTMMLDDIAYSIFDTFPEDEERDERLSSVVNFNTITKASILLSKLL